MTIFAFLAGTILPAVTGWLFLRVVEDATPVLLRAERMVLGWMSGIAMMLSASFTANVFFSVPFSRMGFLGVWLVLTLIVGGLFLWRKKFLKNTASTFALPEGLKWKLWLKALLCILLAIAAVKIAVSVASLLTTPPFFDDTLNNWNIRGKVYFVTQKYELLLPLSSPGTEYDALSAYPPVVPLAKTWLSALAGSWSEGLAGSVHVLWFGACLVLTWNVLRRLLPKWWAWLGTYMLVSLPLFFLQGVSTYADVCQAAHLFAAIAYLALAFHERDEARAGSLLRVSVVLAALLPFVKNEGLLLYLPTFLLIAVVGCVMHRRNRTMSMKNLFWNVVLPFLVIFALFCGPWLLFKMMHGMPFGNAKNVSGLAIGWQKNVIYSIVINTFSEGNWLLLFPLFFGLIAFRWRQAFRGFLLPITACVFILYVGQFLLFLFTSLSYEALMQTGYARGIIHLAPLIVTICTVLLFHLVEGGKQE